MNARLSRAVRQHNKAEAQREFDCLAFNLPYTFTSYEQAQERARIAEKYRRRNAIIQRDIDNDVPVDWMAVIFNEPHRWGTLAKIDGNYST